MTRDILTKETARELMRSEEVARGIASRDEFDYVSSTYGPEGVLRVEKTLAEAGLTVKYKEIKPMGFYPLGQEAAVLLAIKQTFGFEDQKFDEIGRNSARQSFLLKLLMSFVSLGQAVKAVPRTWQRHYLVGELSVPDWNEEKKFLILRLTNFKVHPLQCLTLQGYFAQTLQMILKQPVLGRETKCIFRGDNCHEFLMTW